MGELKTPNGRLTEAGVRAIREKRKAGLTLAQIAAELGVTIGTVWNVASGKTWGWLR